MADGALDLDTVQAFMRERRVDGWLLHDFRNTNPVFLRLFPHTGSTRRHVTRRSFVLIPCSGPATLVCQSLDEGAFAGSPSTARLERRVYTGWKQLHDVLGSLLGPHSAAHGPALAGSGRARRIAMEYSGEDALPVMSITPAGVVELARALGAEVVSSADLVQVSAARWGAAARANHAKASALVAQIKDETFQFIGRELAAGRTILEFDAAEFVRSRFQACGLEWPDGPIVSVNAHAADPHYEPSTRTPTPIRPGDWVLLDLWARLPGDENIYSDITWTAYAGTRVPPAMRKVFDLVREARDAALRLAQESWKASRAQGKSAVQGWQLDQAARDVFDRAGMLAHVKHRTGHSLSAGALVHGIGMNLDNFETRDTREMLPEIGFTIEPGLYLSREAAESAFGAGTPSFGVRNEINVYVDPREGPVVTSCVQDDIVLLA